MRLYQLAFLLFGTIWLSACTTVKTSAEKTAEQENTAKLIQSQNFIYNASDANPQRVSVLDILPNGAGQQLRHLSPGYFLSISKDTVKARLPFYGRAYQSDFNTNDNGIMFTSTKYTYSFSRNRHGYYVVTIVLKDVKNADKLIFNISDNGYGTLQVHSIRRDMMSFYGQLEGLKTDIL